MNEYQEQVTEKWANTDKWKSATIVYKWDGAVYCKQLDKYYSDAEYLYEDLVDRDPSHTRRIHLYGETQASFLSIIASHCATFNIICTHENTSFVDSIEFMEVAPC